MEDQYSSYRLLSVSEKKGRDYIVRCEDRSSGIVVIGPHAGRIELGISELVEAVAGSEYSFYLFEGMKPQGNRALHITSTNFDEPIAARVLLGTKKAIVLHGEGGEDKVVYIGGRDTQFRPHIVKCLQRAGFATARHQSPVLQGTSERNICNRCTSGEGLQLELSRGLRRSLFHSLDGSGHMTTTERFYAFVDALRQGIESASMFLL